MVVNGCSSSVLSHQEMVGNDTPEITCFGLRGMQNIKLNYMQYDVAQAIYLCYLLCFTSC